MWELGSRQVWLMHKANEEASPYRFSERVVILLKVEIINIFNMFSSAMVISLALLW